MAAIVAKLATKKFLDDSRKPYKKKKVVGKDDPLFEMVPVPGKPGKKKKVKKQIPNYIPDHDALVLAKAKKLAYLLDMSYSIGGISLGISSIVALIPVFGDFLDLAMAAYLYSICAQVDCGLDSKTKSKMLKNLGLDFAVGIIPVIGDLGDAYFRCNTKNVKLLCDRLDDVYMPAELKQKRDRGERWWNGISFFKSQENERPPRKSGRRNEARQDEVPYSPATVYEEFSDDESPGLPITEPAHERRKPSNSRPNRR